MIARYRMEPFGDDPLEADTMLYCDAACSSAAGTFAAPTCCPHCGDWMVAPLVSEFVVGGEIRHHWECDGCGETSTTLIPLDRLQAPAAAE